MKTNNHCLLVIEDEPQLRKIIKIIFEDAGFKVEQASSSKEGHTLAAALVPDIILLDLGLPDESGLDLLKEIKVWFHNPVIILSAIDNEDTIIEALDLGASDYVTKPFRPRELVARVKSAMRQQLTIANSTVKKIGALEIDYEARTVRLNASIIKLTKIEFNLLAAMAANEGRILTHRFLLKEVWGNSFSEETQYLRVYIGNLRKKIEADPNNPQYIITESGVGYRFS